MKKKLIISIGIVLLVGLTVIPIAVYFAANLIPYAIAVSCIAGIMALSLLGYKEDTISTIEIVKQNSYELKEEISQIKNVLNSLTEEIKEDRKIKKEMVNDFQGFVNCIHESLINQIINTSNDGYKRLQNLNGTLQGLSDGFLKKFDEMAMLAGQIKDSISDMDKHHVSILKEKTDMIQSLLTAFPEDVTKTSDNIISAIKNHEHRISLCLDNLQKNQSDLAKFLQEISDHQTQWVQDLSSSTQKFIDNHDEILSNITDTVKKVEYLQDNMDDVVSNLARRQEELLKNITTVFQLSSSDLIRQIKSSHEDLIENLSGNLDRIQEQIEESVESINIFSKNTSANINGLNNLMVNQDKKLKAISNYIPQLNKLNESEERMMRDLARICQKK